MDLKVNVQVSLVYPEQTLWMYPVTCIVGGMNADYGGGMDGGFQQPMSGGMGRGNRMNSNYTPFWATSALVSILEQQQQCIAHRCGFTNSSEIIVEKNLMF